LFQHFDAEQKSKQANIKTEGWGERLKKCDLNLERRNKNKIKVLKLGMIIISGNKYVKENSVPFALEAAPMGNLISKFEAM
jgi:hypothetical protein